MTIKVVVSVPEEEKQSAYVKTVHSLTLADTGPVAAIEPGQSQTFTVWGLQSLIVEEPR